MCLLQSVRFLQAMSSIDYICEGEIAESGGLTAINLKR